MFRYISKNKGILVLAAIVLASFFWMTSQVRQPGRGGFVERGVSLAAYPFVKAVKVIAGTAGGAWEGYFSLVGAKKDNARLMKENSALALQNLKLREALARDARFSDLQALKDGLGLSGVSAKVVGRDSSSWFKSVWIDKGEKDGVSKNLPAALYTGVVGKVIRAHGGSARVMLITDPSSAVSSVSERTREPGIAVGDGGGGCRMMYVGKYADMRAGDLIITSGLDGVFPAGLPVGEVVKVSKDGPGYFLEVHIRPTADIARLEELLVLDYRSPRPAAGEAK